jgi:hypothetical protein
MLYNTDRIGMPVSAAQCICHEMLLWSYMPATCPIYTSCEDL